ncbi:MAG: hypothetical protein WC515_08535 [Candidatus Omnitrophota bacterium]
MTLVAFLFNIVSYDTAWAAGTSPSEFPHVGPDRNGGPGVTNELRVNTFALPEYLGRIKETWLPSSKPDTRYPIPNTVIHIQDAHCNYAAQHKIADILDYLNTKYGIDTINLEGGARGYDLSIFTTIYDRATREKVSDDFVREGLVNGAEYFAINNPEKAVLWGVEDVDLYIENLNIYKESLQHKEEVDRYLKELNHILNNLKRHIYSNELFELDLKYVVYKGGNLEFKDYISYLTGKAKERLIDIKAYANIYLLSQALEQEVRLDFKKANRERDGLVDVLQKKLSRRELEELVLKTLEFKTDKISHQDFYAYLAKKARSVNQDLSDYPELQKYIIYISTYSAIDKAKVIEEVDDIEGALKGSLYENDAQRTLARLSKNLALLRNIFAVSLTKNDYVYYLENRPSFDMKNFTAFIDEYGPRYKITAKLDPDISKIDGYRDNITKFYECSLKRDDAFIKNMRFAPKVPKTAIMITGGFHTENLCQLFKKEGIAYVSIMPNFKNEERYESPYFRLLAGELTGIQKRLYSVIKTSGATMQIYTMLSRDASAKEVWDRYKVDAFRVSVYIRYLAYNKTKLIVTTDAGEHVFGYEGPDAKEEKMALEDLLIKVGRSDTMPTGMIGLGPAAPRAEPVFIAQPARGDEKFERAEELLRNFARNEADGKAYGQIKVLIGEMPPAQRAMLLGNVVKNEYGLSTRQVDYFGMSKSQWDVVCGLFTMGVFTEREAIPYLAALIGADPSGTGNGYVWRILGDLSGDFPGEVLSAVQEASPRAGEYMYGWAFGIGMDAADTVRSISIIFRNYFGSYAVPQEKKREYAGKMLRSIELALARGDRFETVLVMRAVEVLEPDTRFESDAWRAAHANVGDKAAREEARDAHIRQLIAMNKIFQGLFRLISEGREVTYARAILLVTEDMGADFGTLNKAQKVAVRTAIISFFERRNEVAQKMEAARKAYPIDEFNAASQTMLDLNRRKRELEKAGGRRAAEGMKEEISKHIEYMNSLRARVAPYLKEEFGIEEKDAPTIAFIKEGPFSLEVVMDMESLQRVFRGKYSPGKETALGNRMRDYFLGLNTSKTKVDLESLREIIEQFPDYLYFDFQNEMVAYMLNADLRSRDFRRLIDVYATQYASLLIDKIKRYGETHDLRPGTLRSIEDMIRGAIRGDRMRQLKMRLIMTKRVLDRLVDIKATILFDDMTKGKPGTDRREAKNRAYVEASNDIMGLFQLIPVRRISMLRDILADEENELKRRGIGEDGILKKDILLEGSNYGTSKMGETIQVGGTVMGDAVFSMLGDEEAVVDHERQHIIFSNYTSGIVSRNLRARHDFYLILDLTMHSMPSPSAPGRGFSNRPNAEYSDHIRNAIDNLQFGAARYSNGKVETGVALSTGQTGTRVLNGDERSVLEKAIGLLGDEDRALLGQEDARVLFIDGLDAAIRARAPPDCYGSHYGLQRNQYYLDIGRLKDAEELAEHLHHEIQERAMVLSGLIQEFGDRTGEELGKSPNERSERINMRISELAGASHNRLSVSTKELRDLTGFIVLRPVSAAARTAYEATKRAAIDKYLDEIEDLLARADRGETAYDFAAWVDIAKTFNREWPLLNYDGTPDENKRINSLKNRIVDNLVKVFASEKDARAREENWDNIMRWHRDHQNLFPFTAMSRDNIPNIAVERITRMGLGSGFGVIEEDAAAYLHGGEAGRAVDLTQGDIDMAPEAGDTAGLTPAMQRLLFNRQNISGFLAYASYLRRFVDFDRMSDGVTPPLEYALKNRIYFRIGGDLYMTPVTESFRRFIIFEMNEKGALGARIEVKIPGEGESKQAIAPDNYDFAKEISDRYGEGKISTKMTAMIALTEPLNMYGEEVDFSASRPARVIIFDYTHDGNRIEKVPLEKMNGEDRRKIAEQVIEEVARVHTLGIYGSSDMSLGNFRLARSADGNPIVLLVGDFQGYRRTEDRNLFNAERDTIIDLLVRYSDNSEADRNYLRQVYDNVIKAGAGLNAVTAASLTVPAAQGSDAWEREMVAAFAGVRDMAKPVHIIVGVRRTKDNADMIARYQEISRVLIRIGAALDAGGMKNTKLITFDMQTDDGGDEATIRNFIAAYKEATGDLPANGNVIGYIPPKVRDEASRLVKEDKAVKADAVHFINDSFSDGRDSKPDLLFRIALAHSLVDYIAADARNDSETRAYVREHIVGMFERMTASPGEVEKLKKDIKRIFEADFLLMIKPVDFKTFEDYRRSAEATLRAV